MKASCALADSQSARLAIRINSALVRCTPCAGGPSVKKSNKKARTRRADANRLGYLWVSKGHIAGYHLAPSAGWCECQLVS